MQAAIDQQKNLQIFKILFSGKFLFSVFFAWLVFIAIDFIFHAAILAALWSKEGNSVRPVDELLTYIPEGYVSFLILTLFFTILYKSIYVVDPGIKATILYSVFVGFLFSLSALLGLYSFVPLSLLFLICIHLVYWIEIIFILLAFRYLYWSQHSTKKKIWRILLIFFSLLIAGIVLQNIFKGYSPSI